MVRESRKKRLEEGAAACYNTAVTRADPAGKTLSAYRKEKDLLMKKICFIANSLSYGVKGHGTVGLITYLRTDSTRIADEAIASAAEYITKNLDHAKWSSRLDEDLFARFLEFYEKSVQ